MKLIGLCGGSGSGKGVVCSLFSELGVPSIDTDKVYHEMTCGPSPCLSALVDAFGSSVLKEDGSLNRVRLANIVFADGADNKRRLLSKITHKFILERTDEIASSYFNSGIGMVIVDAPLLFESGYDKKCDCVISVVADEELRISRIIARDGISTDRAKSRISKQLGEDFLRSNSDFCIENNGDIHDLRNKVNEIYLKLNEME